MRSGIYAILNLINGKCYVGSAVNIQRRWRKHAECMQTKTHSRKLQNALNKYGVGNFKFLTLEHCAEELLLEREQYWIDGLDSYKNGYNTREKAASNLGLRFGPRQRPMSEEHRQKLLGRPGHWKGKKLSREHIQKMSDAKKGKVCSAETRKKLSLARKGKKLSEEHKKNMSLCRIGKVKSEETRAKISNSHKGKKLSENQKENISCGAKKWANTTEGREKLRQAAKIRWERYRADKLARSQCP